LASGSGTDLVEVTVLAGRLAEHVTIEARNVIITGTDGSILDGLHSFRPLTLSHNSNVTVKGLQFVRGKGEDGGAISVTTGSFLTVEGCQFLWNLATASGGALSVDRGSLHVANSKFEHNSVLSHSLVANAVGGAIAIRSPVGSNLNLSDSLFKNNSAMSPVASRGGGIGWPGDTTGNMLLHRNTFISNKALYGGAISVAQQSGQHAITSCNFIENAARDEINLDNAPSEGGAIHVEQAQTTLDANMFELNQADFGGALSLSQATVSACHTD
jgi:hypothetical protein